MAGVRWRVYLALVIASLLWGSLYTAAKPAVAVTGPIQVTWCRVVLAFLSLGLLTLFRSGFSGLMEPLRSHWRGIIVLGLLNFSVSQMLALSALEFLPASVSGVLNNTHPLWVATATAVLRPPRHPRLLVIGSAIALVGVVLVFAPDLMTGIPILSAVGVGLSLAGSLVIASGTVIGRRVVLGRDPIAVSAVASGAAIVPVSVLTLASGGFGPIFSAAGDIKLLLLYVGIGCTAVNFALWYYGLKHLPAAPASAFQYLIAPTGVALAAVFLGESITILLVAGTLCILLGLAITQVAATPIASWRSPRRALWQDASSGTRRAQR